MSSDERVEDVEFARLSAILLDAVSQADLLSHVPKGGSEQLSALASSLASRGYSGVAAELEALGRVEARYFEALRTQGSGRSSSSVVLGDYGSVREQLRAVGAAVQGEPGARAALEGAAAHPQAGGLVEVLRDLLAVVRHRLYLSRARRADDAREMANRQVRIDAGEEEAARLGEALRRQRAAQRKALSDLDVKAALLAADLAASTALGQDALADVQGLAASRAAAVRETTALEEAALRTELDRVQVEYRVSCDAHAEAEAALRKRLVRGRLEHETAVREYDSALGGVLAKAAAARELGAERQALADFEQYFARVDAEGGLRAREAALEEREHLLKVTLGQWVKEHRIKTFLAPWAKDTVELERKKAKAAKATKGKK